MLTASTKSKRGEKPCLPLCHNAPQLWGQCPVFLTAYTEKGRAAMSKARNAHAPWWGGQTMTHRQAAATPSPTALNNFFYCPLCSCIALIDRTTTTYYVLATASVFKAPCSESFSFFSFLAPFSFFHVTVTVTVTSSGTAQLPLRSRSPRTCTLHWWEHLFSSKTQNALLLPVPSPGAPIPQFSTIGAGQNTRGAWRSRKPGKHEKEKKTK